jgi:hypothetical protein
MKTVFTIIPQFLKDPQAFYQSVQKNQDLKGKAFSLFISSVIFLMIYGLATGLSHSWQQGLATAVKMPILFLMTLAFTLPALYFFALALLNVRFSVGQASVVVLSGIGVSAFLLLGLAPVTFFFVFTSTNYAFFQLLAVVFVAISGFTGLYYILKGFRYVDLDGELSGNSFGNILLKCWVGLYGFVGAQMTWRLSPLIGDPSMPFFLLRPSRDNFFVDVSNAAQQALGITNTNFSSAFYIGVVVLLIIAFVVFTLPKRKENKSVPQPLAVKE